MRIFWLCIITSYNCIVSMQPKVDGHKRLSISAWQLSQKLNIFFLNYLLPKEIRLWHPKHSQVPSGYWYITQYPIKTESVLFSCAFCYCSGKPTWSSAPVTQKGKPPWQPSLLHHVSQWKRVEASGLVAGWWGLLWRWLVLHPKKGQTILDMFDLTCDSLPFSLWIYIYISIYIHGYDRKHVYI